MRLKNNQGSLLITATIVLIILAVGAISFGLWLAIQSKGTAHKKIIAKEQYYGEAGIQKALRNIQENPQLQSKLTDDIATDSFVLNLIMEDGTKVEVSFWDVP